MVGNPSYRQLIERGIADPLHRKSVIADSQGQLSFADVAPVLARLQLFFVSHDVLPPACVMLELGNTLPSAMCALALMHAGHELLIVPQAGHSVRAAGTEEFRAPSFCRWIITPAAVATVTSDDPASFINVRLNPHYSGDAPAHVQADGPRQFLKTSGSLGVSKLVSRSQSRCVANILAAAQRLRLTPDDRIALPSPIYHGYGLDNGLLAGISSGASIDLQDRGNLLRFLERETQFAPNIAYVTPTFCEALLRLRRRPRSYRYIVVGGDCLAASTREKMEALHGPLVEGYGMTETGLIALGDPEDAPRTMRPLPGVEIRFAPRVDDANGGGSELQLVSRDAFSGYVDADGAAVQVADAFDGKWFRTRDLARPSPDGGFTVLGRCDLSINRNGLLLPFADVESRLRAVPEVDEAVVVAGAETLRGRSLIAFCVLSPRSELRSSEVRDLCATRLPAFAVPDTIRLLQNLPKLPSGKVDRRLLASMAAQPEPA
jgi:acyl-coenzyme A synthetase/AMP-(fatty) acid ligase